jgi:hypothetical protein
MDFITCSAALGSFQKPGPWVISSFSAIADSFPSTSKEPPQLAKPLM